MLNFWWENSYIREVARPCTRICEFPKYRIWMSWYAFGARGESEGREAEGRLVSRGKGVDSLSIPKALLSCSRF